MLFGIADGMATPLHIYTHTQLHTYQWSICILWRSRSFSLGFACLGFVRSGVWCIFGSLLSNLLHSPFLLSPARILVGRYYDIA